MPLSICAPSRIVPVIPPTIAWVFPYRTTAAANSPHCRVRCSCSNRSGSSNELQTPDPPTGARLSRDRSLPHGRHASSRCRTHPRTHCLPAGCTRACRCLKCVSPSYRACGDQAPLQDRSNLHRQALRLAQDVDDVRELQRDRYSIVNGDDGKRRAHAEEYLGNAVVTQERFEAAACLRWCRAP